MRTKYQVYTEHRMHVVSSLSSLIPQGSSLVIGEFRMSRPECASLSLPAASAQIPQGLGGLGKDYAAGCVLERPGHLDLEGEYWPCCLLAVGSQPGTIITVAPYAKHLAISCFHQPRGRQGKGTAERCTQQLEGGEAQQSVGLPELPQNKQIKAT